jgi:hypothetical protein
MNIVKITNKIALATVVLLMYWVFIFVSTTVFGFKVFRENMTEMFLLSVLGIFSVLAGSIILNIMYNLTAIAESRKAEDLPTKPNKRLLIYFLGSLIVIFSLLYLGDQATSNKKERYLVSSASDLVKEQKSTITALSEYSFSKEYINSTSQNIKLLSRVEEKFPQITVIARDKVDGKPLLLGFGGHYRIGKDKEPVKVDYILGTSSEERKYLNDVFDGNSSEHRFSSNDGQYEIYYPVKTEKGQIVLHLSQRSRYGKMGS